MARDFDGSTNRIDYGNVFTPNGNQTFSAWVKWDVEDNDWALLKGHNSGDSAANLNLAADSSNPGQLSFANLTTGGPGFVARVANSASAVSTDVWTHILYTWDGGITGANIHLFIDGTEPGYDLTVNGGGTVLDADGSHSLGGEIPTNDTNLNGQMEAVGWWNRILTQAEIDQLAAGFSPLFLLNGLQFAPDLIGDQRDIISGEAGTLDGTSIVDGPFIIYPESKRLVFSPAAAGGSISGVGAMLFGGNAVLTARGELSGTGQMDFAGAANLTADGELSGQGSMSFDGTADLGGSGDLSGQGDMVFSGAATLVADGVIAGQGAMVFDGNAELIADGELSGVGAASFGGNADLDAAGSGQMSGAGAMVFGGAADLEGDGDLVGVGAIVFGGNADIDGQGDLAGQGDLVFDGAATLGVASGGGGGLTTEQAQQLLEVWRDKGLDAANPKTITEIVECESYDENTDAITKEVRKVGGTTTITRT